jgi:two-component system, LuxR family, response regulator FixJ
MKTSQGTLFVVDDDPKSRKAMAALASSMKIRCETFASAEEFLDRYDSSLTGCALLDFCLGGMDGLQLQARLRAMNSALCVVLISAYADVPLVVHAMRCGAVDFIEKPYRNDDLADAVREAMDRSAHARQSTPKSSVPRFPESISTAVRGTLHGG